MATAHDPESAAILSLSERLDRLMKMMEDGLANMNHASATPLSAPLPTSARSTGAGTQAAGTAEFFPAEGATDDATPLSLPLPLPTAKADGVLASGAWAGESAWPAEVALLPARTSMFLDARMSSSTSTTTSAAAATTPFYTPGKDLTRSASAHEVLDETPCHLEVAAAHVLQVTVSHVLFPVTMEVLHQVFDPFGADKVSLIEEETSCVNAMVVFRSHQDAAQAQEACNGRCIWDGCCVMDISQVQQAMIPTVFDVHNITTKSIVPTITVSRITAGGSLCDTLITCVRAEDDSKNDVDLGLVPFLLAEDISREVLVPEDHFQAFPPTPKFPCALDGELQKCVEEIESESGHVWGSGQCLKIGDDNLELNGICKEAVGGMFPGTSEKKKDGLFLGIGEFLSYGAKVWQPWSPPNPLQIPRIISSDRVFDRGKYIQFLSWPICIDSNSTSTPLSSVSVQRAISERTRLLWMRGECVATLTEMRKRSRHQALKFSDTLMLLIVRKWGPDTPHIYMGNLVFQIGADFDVVPTRTNVQILFHGDQIDIQSRQPWLTPMHNDMQNANVQLRPTPWLSFWSYAVGMLVRKPLSLPRLPLCYSLREIKFKDPWPPPDWACSSANILSWNSDTWRAHLIFGSVPKTRNSLHSPSAKVSCCLLVIHMLVPWKCLIAAEIICERAQFSEISMLKLFSMVLLQPEETSHCSPSVQLMVTMTWMGSYTCFFLWVVYQITMIIEVEHATCSNWRSLMDMLNPENRSTCLLLPVSQWLLVEELKQRINSALMLPVPFLKTVVIILKIQFVPNQFLSQGTLAQDSAAFLCNLCSHVTVFWITLDKQKVELWPRQRQYHCRKKSIDGLVKQLKRRCILFNCIQFGPDTLCLGSWKNFCLRQCSDLAQSEEIFRNLSLGFIQEQQVKSVCKINTHLVRTIYGLHTHPGCHGIQVVSGAA